MQAWGQAPTLGLTNCMAWRHCLSLCLSFFFNQMDTLIVMTSYAPCEDENAEYRVSELQPQQIQLRFSVGVEVFDVNCLQPEGMTLPYGVQKSLPVVASPPLLWFYLCDAWLLYLFLLIFHVGITADAISRIVRELPFPPAGQRLLEADLFRFFSV